MSQDTPLAAMYANGRTMRIVDGPDEVHLLQLARNENKRGKKILERLEREKKKTEEYLRKYGLKPRDVLEINKTTGQKSKL